MQIHFLVSLTVLQTENWFCKLFLMCILFNKVLKVVIISRVLPVRGSNGLTAVMLLSLVIKYWFSLNFMLKNLF